MLSTHLSQNKMKNLKMKLRMMTKTKTIRKRLMKTLILVTNILKKSSKRDLLILRIFQKEIILLFCLICFCIRMSHLLEMRLRYSLYISHKKPYSSTASKKFSLSRTSLCKRIKSELNQ